MINHSNLYETRSHGATQQRESTGMHSNPSLSDAQLLDTPASGVSNPVTEAPIQAPFNLGRISELGFRFGQVFVTLS